MLMCGLKTSIVGYDMTPFCRNYCLCWLTSPSPYIVLLTVTDDGALPVIKCKLIRLQSELNQNKTNKFAFIPPTNPIFNV